MKAFLYMNVRKKDKKLDKSQLKTRNVFIFVHCNERCIRQ
ncbi:hypothetical protein A0O32_1984 [Anoxybacillus flavithermus]|nr:hypothetical protein A0O32_1984 [Anoxybacillus flavithermus]